MRVKLAEALDLLEKGEVVALPTEAVYGLSIDPYNALALDKLLSLKARSIHKGLILVGSDVTQFEPWVDWSQLTKEQQTPVLASWPGPVTWTLPALSHVSAGLRGGHMTLAVRLTAHPPLREICKALGQAIVSTSANISGQPPARSYREIENSFGPYFPVYEAPLGGAEEPTDIYDAASGRKLR